MNEIKSQNKKESENDSDFILVDDEDDNIDYSSISRANENINSKSKFQADRLELKNQNKRLIKRNRELLIQLEEFKKESQIKTTKYIKKIKYIEKINLKTVQDLKDEHENKLAKAKKQITELNNQLIKMKQIEHKSSEEKKSLTIVSICVFFIGCLYLYFFIFLEKANEISILNFINYSLFVVLHCFLFKACFLIFFWSMSHYLLVVHLILFEFIFRCFLFCGGCVLDIE